MTLTKYTSTITLITLFLLITTCTTDNSITGNSDQALSKPTGVLDINGPATGDDSPDGFGDGPVDIGRLILNAYVMWGAEGLCLMGVNELLGHAPTDGIGVFNTNRNIINSSYDFRDNYLSRSEKGEVYTACYCLLSKYSIENNLVNKYHKEHYELVKSSVKIAYQLQHGSSNDQILIKNDIAEKLEDMLKIYRNHENHRDIDPVLDYLDLELNKYENKPKYEIAADFEEI